MGQGSAALDGLRVVFFGMGGVFSRTPLEALLRAGADVRAVVEPAPAALRAADDEPFTRLEPSAWAASGAARRGLPLAGAAGGGKGRSMREIAASVGAPLYSVRRLGDARTVAALAAHEPDALCVACFTRRLPPAILALPRMGALNAHPSLLPENRGPDPLFWMFHEGAQETGVTVHLMDEGLDTGPILAQRRVDVAEVEMWETEAKLEARLAVVAGELLVEALAGLAAGTLTPTPQDEARATYHSWPEAADYVIDASWPVRRALAFASGVFQREEPVILVARDGTRFRLIEPIGGGKGGKPMEQAWRLNDGALMMALVNGEFLGLAEKVGG
ncbi:MAG TPA: formyltransferase family protein [Ktedonobacterales bacterium]|nr:formyltransferase family protein [Ktedonobacterales bacterium]